jgi:transketolase
LGAAPILDEMYSKRRPDEPVILSCGHAGLALYCVLEKYYGHIDAEDLLMRHGVHPTKNAEDGIWCSTGSLGQGITVATGRALVDRGRDVWCLISDGECAEGSVYEALRLAGEKRLTNLRVYCHWNGYGAYRQIEGGALDTMRLLCRWMEVRGIRPEGLGIPFLKAQDAHYTQMSEEDWKWVQSQEIIP